MHRPDVNYPKFKDQFAAMDFEAHILPVLSLYPMPERQALEDWEMKLTDIRGKTVSAAWEDLKKLPRIEEPTPLVCQIFNWSETPLVTGVRLPMLLEAMGMGLSGSRYLSFHSGDGMYFESLPLALARAPRVLVVYGIEGERLPHELGGPVRLWVPFLQGYKSVKWLTHVRGFCETPTASSGCWARARPQCWVLPDRKKPTSWWPASALDSPPPRFRSLFFLPLPGGRGDHKRLPGFSIPGAVMNIGVDPQTHKATSIRLFSFGRPHMRVFHISWMAFFGWFGIAPMMALVRDDLQLTKTEVGNTVIASVAVTIVARLMVGWLCDRIGPRTTYPALLIVGSIPVMSIGLATNYESFLLFQLTIGIIGASFVITQCHTSVTFAPDVVGTANATTPGWGNMGGGVTQMAMPWCWA